MPDDGHHPPTRHWRTVAELLSKEQDHEKIAELVDELVDALKKQELLNGLSKHPDGHAISE